MVPEFVQAISALPTMWQYIFQISMMVPSQYLRRTIQTCYVKETVQALICSKGPWFFSPEPNIKVLSFS